MPKLTSSVYVVLKAKRAGAAVNGQRPAQSFDIDRVRQNRPFTNKGEVAVKLTLTVDRSIFDSLVPEVEIELGEQSLFVNPRAEVIAEEIFPEDPLDASTEDAPFDVETGHSDRDDHGDR